MKIDALRTFEMSHFSLDKQFYEFYNEARSLMVIGEYLVQVLFRSRHQGPKLDIWSAGVSLLYLITGRVPFTGDPEQ